MRRIKRSLTIATTSWQVLRAERGLLAVSLGAHLLALLAAIAVFFGGLALVEAWAAVDGDVAGWVIVALAALAGGAFTVIGQAAVVNGAHQRMAGENVTAGAALGGLRGRFGALLAWAVIATGVGRLLEGLRRRGGSTGSAGASGGRFAFRVVSFLALPVIVVEGQGAVSALRRSWQLLKDTWGENAAFNVGLKLLGALLLAPAIVALVAAQWAGLMPLPLPAFALLLAYGVLVIAGTSALSGVYKAALYRWATDRPIAGAFDRRELQTAFDR